MQNQQNKNITSFLLIASVLMIIVSTIYSLTYLITQEPVNLKSQASESYINDPKTKILFQNILNNAPLNPNQVTATALVNNQIITLESGQSYPYDEITFTWKGAQAREPNTEIIGYFVYFGPQYTNIPFPEKGYENHVMYSQPLITTVEPSYTAKNLEKGVTYYLYVRAKTNSQIPNYDLGLEDLGNFRTLPAKILFVYTRK